MPLRLDLRGEFRAALNELRKPAAFDFIDRLRNNLLHGEVTVPNTVITTGASGTHGTIQFDIDELLAFGTWNPRAQQFICSFGERLPISPVRLDFTEAIRRCHERVRETLRRSPSEAEIDFWIIEDDERRWASCQWIKVILSPFAKKGTDPYPHLPRFFEPDEVREILRRPRHSVEQAELIIALKSPRVACDDELRAMLYKIFGVENQYFDRTQRASVGRAEFDASRMES